ncbi:HNH endonuclease signature motif containing protein [Thermomonospora amylolytica]|uniref:HNH endonuclease signature motif containing protein n=1 Tax=Thermomonospora amylolytica TaxID=1411117 RepID=UPI000E6BEB31|nr:HNH endonuclease signature motif containing protein [Thermomonospora amylolytica]
MAATSRRRDGRRYRTAVAQLRAEAPWVCWLCGKPIDPQLTAIDPQHRLAWTADHVEPYSLDGEPDLANLRPAHRGCNSRRGNRAPRPRPNASRRW